MRPVIDCACRGPYCSPEQEHGANKDVSSGAGGPHTGRVGVTTDRGRKAHPDELADDPRGGLFRLGLRHRGGVNGAERGDLAHPAFKLTVLLSSYPGTWRLLAEASSLAQTTSSPRRFSPFAAGDGRCLPS